MKARHAIFFAAAMTSACTVDEMHVHRVHCDIDPIRAYDACVQGAALLAGDIVYRSDVAYRRNELLERALVLTGAPTVYGRVWTEDGDPTIASHLASQSAFEVQGWLTAYDLVDRDLFDVIERGRLRVLGPSEWVPRNDGSGNGHCEPTPTNASPFVSRILYSRDTRSALDVLLRDDPNRCELEIVTSVAYGNLSIELSLYERTNASFHNARWVEISRDSAYRDRITLVANPPSCSEALAYNLSPVSEFLMDCQ